MLSKHRVFITAPRTVLYSARDQRMKCAPPTFSIIPKSQTDWLSVVLETTCFMLVEHYTILQFWKVNLNWNEGLMKHKTSVDRKSHRRYQPQRFRFLVQHRFPQRSQQNDHQSLPHPHQRMNRRAFHHGCQHLFHRMSHQWCLRVCRRMCQPMYHHRFHQMRLRICQVMYHRLHPLLFHRMHHLPCQPLHHRTYPRICHLPCHPIYLQLTPQPKDHQKYRPRHQHFEKTIYSEFDRGSRRCHPARCQ
mmetsp:Transcript_33332/g.51059  ORF Transcript_33332/g.51059 Transcript_33332/m.51059 type:complete len:247 (-) Transcript_33332:471-1211(-)